MNTTNGNGALSPERYMEAFGTSKEGEELLSVLIRDPLDAGDILDAIEPGEFGNPNHMELWALARKLFSEGRTPDLMSLRREIGTHPRRPVVEAVLTRAVLLAPDGVSVGERVERIRDARRRERLHIAGVRLQQCAADPGLTAAEAHERALSALTEAEPVGDGGPVTIGDAMARFLEAQRSVSADRVCPTPWPTLNVMLGGGLHRQRVYVVGGSTGSGKSNVGLAVAGHAAARGIPSVVFSAEMSEHELAGRWFARTARVPLDDITGYRMGGDAKATARELCATPDPLFLVDRPRVTAAAVHSTTRRLMRQADIRLVVVDYLQLLEAADRRASRQEQVGGISRALKLLSRELDVAVVVLAQLNRGPSARLDSRPRMADLRESGQIEQDSDVVILLHPESADVGGSMVPTFKMELIVDKNRHGRTGSVHLDQEYEYADLT